MLRKHADRVVAADRIVEVVAQACEEPLELLLNCGVGASEEGVDAGDLRGGDVGDIARPVFPVGAGADLVDDLGVDGFLPFGEGEQRHLRRHPTTVTAGVGAVCDTVYRTAAGTRS